MKKGEGSTSKGKKLTVDIYSDIACPWCYVGKKKFLIAKEAFSKSHPDCEIDVNIHAYMIDPATQKNGEEYMAYNVRRWGGDGWTYSLRDAGKTVGCNFSNWKIWPNTFLAHCLITQAGKVKKAEEVLMEIFKLCYEEGENVSEAKTLEKVATQFGIEGDWKSKEVQQAVLADDKKGKKELDIHGVPYFIFQNESVLEGARDASTFTKVFSKYLE